MLNNKDYSQGNVKKALYFKLCKKIAIFICLQINLRVKNTHNEVKLAF